jgi:hypothetical protein
MRTAEKKRLAAIEAEIQQNLPKTMPDSAAVYRCAQLFCEVEDEGLHEVAREPNGDEWGEKRFKVQRPQRAKYLRVGRRLTKEEAQGKTQGLDVMDQIAMAPEVLRPLMWRLAEEERLSSGALSAGRQAAAGLAKEGHVEEAMQELVKVARAKARKEEQEAAARKKAPKLSQGARLACALLTQVVLLIKLLGKRGSLSQQELTEIRGAIARLNELDPHLASQQTPEAPQSQSPPQSQSQSQSQSQPNHGPVHGERRPAGPESSHGAASQPLRSGRTEQSPPQDPEAKQFHALLSRLNPRQQALASQALYDLAAGAPPEQPAARLRRLLKRGLPVLQDPDPDARGLFALRLLILLPNCQMRLRALASMRKVSPAVRAAAVALLQPEMSAGADPSACDRG